MLLAATFAAVAAAALPAMAAEQSAADLRGPELVGPVDTIRRLPPLDNLRRLPPLEKSAALPRRTIEPGGERSERLEKVARQADARTRHGFELAGRGAYFAARAEFLAALGLVAEGLDTEKNTDLHGRALAAALTAMKEADDFLPGDGRLESGLDIRRIVARHTTPVLKNETKNLTSMTALNRYFTFAQQQFAAAAGGEAAGSMALHALAKLHSALARKRTNLEAAAESRAMVYYQAALLAYPENFMAANDLGVLLAECENYDDARAMLEHSLSLHQQPATWCNLAVVYRRLGQLGLAQRAAGQATMLQQAEIARRKATSPASNDVVLWVDPQTFASTSTNTPNSPGAALAGAAAGLTGSAERRAGKPGTMQDTLVAPQRTAALPVYQR
jgi:tetratricopeptide (TPR) repeat protein